MAGFSEVGRYAYEILIALRPSFGLEVGVVVCAESIERLLTILALVGSNIF